MANHTSEQLRNLDGRHHLHPFTNHHRIAAGDGRRIITDAEGIYVFDSDGNRYLDAMSGLWCVNIGYGHSELAEVAAQQMKRLPYYNSFFKTAQLPAVELAAVLAEITPPHYRRAFFGCSGSDANDTIVRLTRYYWQLCGQPQRQVIISRKNSYHGSTIAAASLGGMSTMHAQGGLPIPAISHIEQPYYFGYRAQGGQLSAPEFGLETARALEKEILAHGADKVAAFIGEPIQGAGGVIIPPDTYWPEIQRICKKYDILLIVDEVICGFGRTGTWFGSESFAIEGDFMTLAKGLSSGYQPISAVMVGDKVAEVISAHDNEFSHGYTYSGHPVACAVALKNIEILQRERIIERARAETMGYLHAKVQTLADHPLIGEVRVKGFVGALELVAEKTTRPQLFDPALNVGKICSERCFANGLIMRPVNNTLVFAPPLVIRTEEIDEFINIVKQTLDQVHQQIVG